MPEIDVGKRIRALCEANQWTCYRLAKQSGVPYSTLNTMLRHNEMPSIPTLSNLCKGFGISLSQFFAEDEQVAMVTAEQLRHLALWNQLSKEQQAHAESYLRFLLTQQTLEET